MSNSKRTISFSVDNEFMKHRLNEYAILKGYRSAGDMARKCLMDYLGKRGDDFLKYLKDGVETSQVQQEVKFR